jgi:hypothetical protein
MPSPMTQQVHSYSTHAFPHHLSHPSISATCFQCSSSRRRTKAKSCQQSYCRYRHRCADNGVYQTITNPNLGAICLLVVIALFFAFARRRRIRNGTASGPFLSSPWGRPPPPYPPAQGPSYPQQNYNTEYPPQNSWAPPAYKPEQTFAPVC